MMKKFFKNRMDINVRWNIIGVFVLCFLTDSCTKYLEIVPDNIAVLEDAFSTRDNALKFLATLYDGLPPFENIDNPALAAGDEIYVNDVVAKDWGARKIATGGQNVVNPYLGYWGNKGTVKNLFISIRNCNIFLDNIELPFNLQENEKRKWTAEAKFLKAYFHFYLLRMYGPIPVIRENIEVSSGVDAVRVYREPVDVVGSYIVDLLDEAILDLPLVVEDRGLELGRITAPIAAAMKARVLIHLASPLFNGNTDYQNFQNKNGEQLVNIEFDPEKWNLAAIACKAAIDIAHEAGHKLFYQENTHSDWSDTTVTKLSIRGSITERWNEEVIWGASNRQVFDLQNWAQGRIATDLVAETWETVGSWWSPPLHIAEMFYSNNGVPINEDVQYNYNDRYSVAEINADQKNNLKAGYKTAILNMHRENRFYASLGFDGGKWFGHGINNEQDALTLYGKQSDIGGKISFNRWSQSGYLAKKLVFYENVQRSTSAGYTNRSYPFPVIRLADLYLMYAEALNEYSGPSEEVYQMIDEVRRRAGLNGVIDSWKDHSNQPSKPTTKEGLRDIIQRERMIELVFEGHRFWDLRRWKKAHEFMNKTMQGWNVEGNNTETYYNIVSYGQLKFSNRDYLWPIAEIDLITNTNLVQNPGW